MQQISNLTLKNMTQYRNNTPITLPLKKETEYKLKRKTMKKVFISACSFLCMTMVANAQTSETPVNQDSVQTEEETLQAPPEEPEKTPMEKLEDRTSEVESKVDKLSKLSISGYIQAQYQYGQEYASPKVGNNTNETLGTDDEGGFGRFGVRRGRLKTQYKSGLTSATFEIDITEKGFATKNAYFNIKDPWLKTCAFQAGIFDRPFGYELGYSSNQRESPEYSAVCQTIFPDEKDLGAMLILAPSKESPLNFLKLNAGLFAGNGMKQDSKTLRDFIGKLTASKNIGTDGSWELGFSYYKGGVFQGNKNVYDMDGKAFTVDSSASNVGEYAKRQYFGLDGALIFNTEAGQTKLMAEYLWGNQPGTSGSSKSPNDAKNPAGDTYLRNFNGYYVMLVQDLGQTPFSLVAKYDSYDPNTDVDGDNVGKTDKQGSKATNKTDLSQSTFGAGLIWRAMSNVRLTAYYEVNSNETSKNVAGYDKDRKDNLFTLRMQYKF